MYKSPINMYINETANMIMEQKENQIMTCITEKYAIDVDKQQLIRALNYDREQYKEGYRDAEIEYKQKMQEMIAEIEYAKEFWGKYKRNALVIEMEEIIYKYCDKEQNNEKD